MGERVGVDVSKIDLQLQHRLNVRGDAGNRGDECECAKILDEYG